MSNHNILLVEDDQAIADTLRYSLQTEGFTPFHCTTALEALQILSEKEFALAILDVGLPDLSGFELCKRIRLAGTRHANIPVIFLTARAEEVDRVLGLELGGDDYVTKPFSPREMVARVKAILRRVKTEEPSSKPPNMKFRIDSEIMKVIFKGSILELSRYEYRLLCILINRPGKVYSREELMDRAWESPEMSLERTVDAHIKSIRSKLRSVDPDDDSILTQRGFGYALKVE